MKKSIIILILLISFIAEAQYTNTVYIDPSLTTGLQDGTSPANAWRSAEDYSNHFESNTAYLWKSGTVDTMKVIYIGNIEPTTPDSNIYLGVYGGTEMAYLKSRFVDWSTTHNSWFGHPDGIITIRSSSHDILIRDLKIGGGKAYVSGSLKIWEPTAHNAIKILGSDDAADDWIKNITVKNCEFIYCGSGLLVNGNVSGITNALYDSIRVHHIGAEGLWGKHHRVTASNCWLDSINLGWFQAYDAGGDGIQLGPHYNPNMVNPTDRWSTIIVEYNNVDRSATGNKFCHQHGGTETITDSATLIVRYNTFKPPMDSAVSVTVSTGTACYYDNVGFVYVYGNKFDGRGYVARNALAGATIWCDADHEFFFMGNTMDSTSNIYTSSTIKNRKQLIYNNTIIACDTGGSVLRVNDDTIHWKNNLIAIHSGRSESWIDGNTHLIDSSHNIFIEGDSLTWNTRLGITDWEASDFTIPNSSANSYKFGEWHEDMYAWYREDIEGIAVPQTTGAIYEGEAMDIGAYQLDESEVPTFPPIIYDFTANRVLGSVDDRLVFTGTYGRAPYHTGFNFGSTTISTIDSTGVIYDFVGTYTVTDTAINEDGSAILTKTDYITISSSIYGMASFTQTQDSTDVNDTIDFTNTSINTPDSYVWTYSGGTAEFINSTYTDTDVSIKFLQDAIYTVILKATKGTDIDYYKFVLDGIGGTGPCPECPPRDTTIIINKVYLKNIKL